LQNFPFVPPIFVLPVLLSLLAEKTLLEGCGKFGADWICLEGGWTCFGAEGFLF
jgi:hypothetical protein